MQAGTPEKPSTDQLRNISPNQPEPYHQRNNIDLCMTNTVMLDDDEPLASVNSSTYFFAPRANFVSFIFSIATTNGDKLCVSYIDSGAKQNLFNAANFFETLSKIYPQMVKVADETPQIIGKGTVVINLGTKFKMKVYYTLTFNANIITLHVFVNFVEVL